MAITQGHSSKTSLVRNPDTDCLHPRPQLLRTFLACSTTLKLPKGSTTQVEYVPSTFPHPQSQNLQCGVWRLHSWLGDYNTKRQQVPACCLRSIFSIPNPLPKSFSSIRGKTFSKTWGGFEEEGTGSLPPKESNLETQMRLLLNALHTDSVIMCSSCQNIQ